MKHRIALRPTALAVAAAVALAAFPLASSADEDSQSQIQRGYQISPVPLDLAGKNRALVGLGSYIVNTGGCNDCHTSPSYAPGGNPFLGEPEQINTSVFLAGGQHFGPFVSLNLTPDAQGRPAGLTFDEFRTLLRTGHDPDAAPGTPPLQVMPWPAFGKKTDRDLRAIYEYLRAIPPLPDNY
ncbi:MAG TPA: cytochrome C [Casimicrobiaceae bacterium]|nr:cytochrome C [Casimicrobiaceae bacterium]